MKNFVLVASLVLGVNSASFAEPIVEESAISVKSVKTNVSTPSTTVKPLDVLLKENGCAICHQKDKTSMGPSLKDIAAKEGNTVAVLKHAIQNGSKGKYGKTMPAMKKVSDSDAEVLAQAIMAVK